MRTSSKGIILVLLVAFVGSWVTRDWAQGIRSAYEPKTTGGGRSFGRLNSYALALLLGGLRGPLVMVLWTSSESQKTDKNLEDFDTKVEWIRLLQPEFDTVHIFQIWNKAYNISVQMASLANKYYTILDALDYAASVDREKPDDINILTSMAQVYFDKLGNSTEKFYYRPRVMDETMARPVTVTFPAGEGARFEKAVRGLGVDPTLVRTVANKDGVTGYVHGVTRAQLEGAFSGDGVKYPDIAADRAVLKNDPGYRRQKMDPVLDDAGNILPNLLVPRFTNGTSPDSYDGSDLQYLKEFEPFPYGVDPFGLAYNYFKRSAVLQNEWGQRHAQLSDLVVDSRPGLTLKSWGEESWAEGRRLEMTAYRKPALPTDAERPELEEPTASISPSAPPPNTDPLKRAIYSYAMAVRLCDSSLREYDKHLKLHEENRDTYLSHVDTVKATRATAAADRDYLSATVASAADRAKLLAEATKNYQEAIRLWIVLELRYYIPEPVVQQAVPGSNRQTVANLNFNQALQAMDHVRRIMGTQPDQYSEDRGEYDAYIRRAFARLNLMPH